MEYFVGDFKTESEQKLLLCCDVCINDWSELHNTVRRI